MSFPATDEQMTSAAPGAQQAVAPTLKSRLVPWRECQSLWATAAAAGHMSPYQTWPWISAWNEEIEEPKGQKPVVLVVEDSSGAFLLLPLTLKKIGPAVAAVVVGEDHANFKFPILSDSSTSWNSCTLHKAIASALRTAGVDLFILDNMPLEWQDVANPLAVSLTHPGPTAGFKTDVFGNIEGYLQNRLSHSHLKKHRQKERGLGRLAPLDFIRVSTQEQADKVLDAFFQLKADRFAEMGIPDVFRDDQIKAFMRRSATEFLGSGTPALVLYALLSGDRVVAVYGGCEHGSRFSGSVNAMALDSETRRYSPGDILLLRLIGDCGERGFRTFDLGLGEASYKTQYCPDTQQVYDGVIAVSPVGSAVAKTWHGWRYVKSRLKQHPMILAGLQHVRRALVR
jgi:CelD/BcsL family acetyltransferase involved in cellulose biosynthesis